MAGRFSSKITVGGAKNFIGALCAIAALPPVILTLMRLWAGGTGSDFWSLWGASRAALEGRSAYTLPQVFPYPPHSLFLFIPFSLTSFGLGLILFNVAGITFFACAAKPYLPKGFPLVFAVCSPATLLCLFFGQTSLIVGGLWLFAFRGRWAAVAALTFKPHMGLLSVLSLKSWADVWRTTALALLLIAASIIAFGFHIWVDFANALVAHADRIGIRNRWLVLGVGPAIGYGVWGWPLFASAAAYLLSRQINPFTAATASLLISPYALHYDMPVACLGFLLAIYSHWETLGAFQRAALAFGFLSPIIVYLGTWWIPPILLWALWVQVRLPTSTVSSVEPATV